MEGWGHRCATGHAEIEDFDFIQFLMSNAINSQ